MDQTEAHSHDHDAHHHHIIPKAFLTKIFGALVVLTVVTVLVAQVDLGVLNVPVALFIAGVKASLVVAFFMALWYDNRVNALVFTVGTVFVVVFLTFTILDTAFRGDVSSVAPETIGEQERRAERLRQREPDPANLRVAPADYADTTAADTTNTSGATDEQSSAGGEDTQAPDSQQEP